MAGQGLEIKRSSASLWGEKTGMRQLPVVSKYIDTSTCIGCKACEVACQEWNDLKVLPTKQTGTYQTLPGLDAEFWNLIRFSERETPGGGLAWLMRKDQCMHCEEPGCLEACPAPGVAGDRVFMRRSNGGRALEVRLTSRSLASLRAALNSHMRMASLAADVAAVAVAEGE